MEIALYTLKTIAYAITEFSFVLFLIILGIIFYKRNKKTSFMQKMIIGESLNSPLELTLSQITLGIFAGAIGSIMLSYLGVVFNENSVIYLLFMISVFLMIINPKFICFSYSGAVLGFVSIVCEFLNKTYNIPVSSAFLINIVSLVSLIGVLHIVEGLLVMIDGSKGAIPVFANRNDRVIGGFSLKRYWALPIAIFIMVSSNNLILPGDQLSMPNWWPILKGTISGNIVKNPLLMLIPFYGIIGYNSITFTKSKQKKSFISGSLILLYGVLIIFVAQLANLGYLFKIFVVIFTPLMHELITNLDRMFESTGKPKYISGNKGIMVLEVAPNSPAKEMGLESGDLLLEINNKVINVEQEIFEAIKEIPNFIWLKIKKQSGEIKEVNYNRMREGKRLGVVLVPRYIRNDDNVIGYNIEKFKDILEKLKEKEKEK